jgi:DNA-binding transcriptional regulator YiaG
MDQELVQYLDSRFQSVNTQFQELRREMTEGLEEVKRHSGVLVEGLRHELQLVAEGFAMHVQVQHVQEREYHDRQHQETRALIRSIYDELRQRVENLEQKRQN